MVTQRWKIYSRICGYQTRWIYCYLELGTFDMYWRLLLAWRLVLNTQVAPALYGKFVWSHCLFFSWHVSYLDLWMSRIYLVQIYCWSRWSCWYGSATATATATVTNTTTITAVASHYCYCCSCCYCCCCCCCCCCCPKYAGSPNTLQ